MKINSLISNITWLTFRAPDQCRFSLHTYYWPALWAFALRSLFLHSDTPPPLSFRLSQANLESKLFP
jgi:hypothetical protein